MTPICFGNNLHILSFSSAVNRRQPVDVDTIKCTACESEEKNDKEGRRHIRFCKKVPCLECSKEFMSDSLIKKHLPIHGDRWKCECGKSYSSNAALKRHQTTYRDVKFECDLCASSFSAQCSLTRH